MPFKLTIIVFLCIFICSCHDKTDKWIDPAKYHCSITINGENTSQGVLISSYKDSLLSLAMERTTSDALYWEVVFSPFSKKTQNVVLHKRVLGQLSYGDYYASCCVPPVAPGPDITWYKYFILEDDSLTNILHVDVDTSSKYLSGNFSATFINKDSPYDTVRMICTAFSCNWE